MTSSARGPFWLVRLRRFLSVLLASRMASIGLLILIVFSFLALGAPLVTPYDPDGTVVSGQRAPPAWITLITGDAGWSHNTLFTGLDVRSVGPVTVNTLSKGTDSVEFEVTSQTDGTKVQVVKTLAYPFNGPPARFEGSVSVTPTGLGGARVAPAKAYLERVGEYCCWTLWQANLNITREYSPDARFDSNGQSLRRLLGFDITVYNAAEIIFPRPGNYVYGLEITLPAGQARFSVRGFELSLDGNSWGLLGTDSAGHDIFSQLIYGARISLLVGLLATFIGVGVGLLVGLLAGYLGKMVDEVLMRFTDMMLVVPGLPLLIVLVAVLGSSINNIIIVLGFLGWMGFARVVRSQVLSLRERPFIEAAKASGAGTGYITLRHIFPNIVSLTYVNLALSVPAAIVGEAALSFLGLGDSTQVSWGRMLEQARSSGAISNLLWWWTVPPGLSIALLSLSFILLGYALDDIFNPKLRKRR
jgi:peptide/nickel transport system permease protein